MCVGCAWGGCSEEMMATTARSEMSAHRELDAILSLEDLDRQKVALQVRPKPPQGYLWLGRR